MGPFGIRKTLLARAWCFQRADGTSNMRTRPSGVRTRPSSARAHNAFGERVGFLDTAASITTALEQAVFDQLRLVLVCTTEKDFYMCETP